jgi:hypothetical protein
VQIALLGDFDNGQATVLLVIGAQAAIEGASALHGGVATFWRGGRFVEASALSPVGSIVGDEHALGAMLGAELLEEDAGGVDQDLGFDFAEARGTKAVGQFDEGGESAWFWGGFAGWGWGGGTATALVVPVQKGIGHAPDGGELNGAERDVGRVYRGLMNSTRKRKAR